MFISEECLFSDRSRDENRGSKYGEHPFDYLDSSARSEAQDIRTFLENAFKNYPEQEKGKLRKRIRDKKIYKSQSAIFELILHEVLLSMGCKAEVEQELSNGKKTKPDFLVTTKGGDKFYLEATCVHDEKCQSVMRQGSLLNFSNLIDQLNEEFKEEENAVLSVSLVKQGKQAFKKQNLYSDIRSKLKNLLNTNDESHQWRWSNGKTEELEWIIEFQLWKRTSKARRFVGTIYDHDMVEVNVSAVVKKAVKKKSTKYGFLQCPLLLAINVDAWGLDKTSEMEALFGKEQFIFTKEGPKWAGRQKNGAWFGKNTRVAGVWLFDNLNLWRLHKRHVFYLNPFRQQEVPKSIYSLLPHATCSEGKMSWQKGINVCDILEVNWDWLLFA